MAIKIDNKKFLGIEQVTGEVVKPKIQTPTFNPLKEINQTIGYANSILKEFGVDDGFKGLVKAQINKLKGNSNKTNNIPQYQAPQPPMTQKQPQQVEIKEEKMKFDIKKLNAVIDLVIKFKGEDLKVSELKEFISENENLIQTILN